MSDKHNNRVIKTHHIEIVMDCDDRQARRIMERMRELLGKEKHQPVILLEFVGYIGLSMEKVLAKLGWK